MRKLWRQRKINGFWGQGKLNRKSTEDFQSSKTTLYDTIMHSIYFMKTMPIKKGTKL